MNYLEQIVAFHDWKTANPLPASAIALWHELIAVCNKAGWPVEFTVRNDVLQASCGISRKEFDRARQMLIDLQVLHYKKSHRVNSAGKYKLIPFSIVRNGQQNGQRAGQREEHGRGNEGGDLYKDLSSSASSSSSDEYESFYAAHSRVFGFECNPWQANQLAAYIDQDGMEEAVVVRAIERAGLVSSAYNFRLIKRILDDYFKSNVRSLEQAIAIDARFDSKKQTKSANTSTKRSRSTDFSQIARELEHAKV